MSAILFNNIAALAEVCEDWAWGYDFIEKHQRFLAKKEREVTVKLAKAFLLAGQGKYREVISLLQGDKCVSMGDELKRRVQLICALVEVHGDDDSVWENINAFAQFLSTKKLLNSGITKGANNFLRILKYLLKGKQSKEAIHDELEKAEVIYKRSWLEKRLQIYQQKFLSP